MAIDVLVNVVVTDGDLEWLSNGFRMLSETFAEAGDPLGLDRMELERSICETTVLERVRGSVLLAGLPPRARLARDLSNRETFCVLPRTNVGEVSSYASPPSPCRLVMNSEGISGTGGMGDTVAL